MSPADAAAGGGRPPARRRAARVEPSTGAGQVRALTRALAILKALANASDGLTLSDLGALVGLAPSTTHRLLTTLEADRFVRFDRESGLWQIGVQAFVVGHAFARQRDIVALARPYLRQLVEATGETANLYVLVDDEAVCMAQVECRQAVRAIARPGGRAPLHASGVGKAMLACLEPAEVDRLLRRHGLARLTERTLDRPSRLRGELDRVRARGYAIDDEENAPGLRCVGVALLDESAAPLGGVSISGPTARLTDARLAELAKAVVAAAGEIARAIGGRPPAALPAIVDDTTR